MTTTAQITKKSKTPNKANAERNAAAAATTKTEDTPNVDQIDAAASGIELISDFTGRIVEKTIEIDLIDRSETQPRKIFDEAAIAELFFGK